MYNINVFIYLSVNFFLFLSTRYSRLMARLLPPSASLPSVVAVNLKQVHCVLTPFAYHKLIGLCMNTIQHSVYHLSIGDSKQLKDDLSSFLKSLSQGTMEPSGMYHKEPLL